MKTLQECKDQVANKIGYETWHRLHQEIRYDKAQIESMCNEAAELYASQFKPSVVPSTQKPDFFSKEDLTKAFVAGLLNRPDFTIEEFQVQLGQVHGKVSQLIELLSEGKEETKTSSVDTETVFDRALAVYNDLPRCFLKEMMGEYFKKPSSGSPLPESPSTVKEETQEELWKPEWTLERELKLFAEDVILWHKGEIDAERFHPSNYIPMVADRIRIGLSITRKVK